MIANRIVEITNRCEDQVIALRRSIHREPELAFQENKTVEKIVEFLENYGIRAERRKEGTGVTALIHGKNPGRVLLLRADMDALPIEERTGLSYCSEIPGVMHACGHDVHVASLAGVGVLLKELAGQWDGTVKLVFQPAEESGGGGRVLVKEGILENPKVDACMALHVSPGIRPGTISIGNEEVTAASDGFAIKIRGKNAHSSTPQAGIDAINIAAHVIVSLNTILSKMISPLDSSAINIGQISGGSAPNILADEVVLKGMVRNLKDESRNILLRSIKDIAEGTAKMFGGEAYVEIREGYVQVKNNSQWSERVRCLFKENQHVLLDGIEENLVEKDRFIQIPEKELGAEDFGFYTKEVPSCFFWVGTGDTAPAHSSFFQIDEKYIKFCVRSMGLAALDYLNLH